MKYYRKTPVEAIQWKGDNLYDVHDFIVKTAKYCCSRADSGSLVVAWEDLRGRKFKTVVPLFGWVVRDDKTLLFYRNPSFKRTFEEVPDDDSKGVDREGINKTIEDVFDSFYKAFIGFNDVFGAAPIKEASDDAIRTSIQINPDGRLTKLIDDLYKDDEKTREEIKKNMSEGLKEMAGSDTHKATFESVLDEMKELHVKKNACYGDAAHVNFHKYGPVASLSRLSEKMQRAEHILLSGKCEVKDEPLTETLIDIAITSAMLYMELKNKGND
jgi:hypothetical protein